MVFLTLVQGLRHTFKSTPIPDRFWKNRRVLRLTGHLYGRRRNCYEVAIRALHHLLVDVTKGRQSKKRDMGSLWDARIDNAAWEHGLSGLVMREALPRCHIFLNKKVLADLAIWEPRTFKALTDVAKCRAANDTDLVYPRKKEEDLSHFATKGLLKDP